MDERETVRCSGCGWTFYLRPICPRCHTSLAVPLDSGPSAADLDAIGSEMDARERTGTAAVDLTEALLREKLKALRQAKGISQRELAKAMGCPRSYISKLEGATVRMMLKTADRLCDSLGVRIEDTLDPRLTVRELAGRTMHAGGTCGELLAAIIEILPRLGRAGRSHLFAMVHDLEKRKQISIADYTSV